jgi:hypothetical protein
MLFSHRKNLIPIRVEIQRDGMDAKLRNKLWSAIQIVVFDPSDTDRYREGINESLFIRRLWIFFFERPVDTVPLYGMAGFRDVLRQWFFAADWNQVYDLVERLHDELKGSFVEMFTSMVNAFLEQELSAYRLIDGQISDITDEQEIESIESAITNTDSFVPVRAHLRAALEKLTDRTSPDYRNSIKESISAVEALCQLITGDKKATLGHALKRLKDAGVTLHPTIESAWSKLYGYTSDAGGIRHALSDERQLGFSDAKYMLVSCTAFVNHLLELVRSADLKLK